MYQSASPHRGAALCGWFQRLAAADPGNTGSQRELEELNGLISLDGLTASHEHYGNGVLPRIASRIDADGILADADLEFAAAHLTAAAFGSAGQRCMAISVAVAVEPVGDRLIELLRNRAAAIRVGPGRQHDSEMGPLVTNDARQRVTHYVDSGEPAPRS